MKEFIRENKILLIAMVLVFAVCVTVIATRAAIEKDNKSYDVVLDYNEIYNLAEQSDHDISWWLAQFKDMGITKVGLTEESIITLMEDSQLPVTGTMMDEVLREANWKDDYPAEFVDTLEKHGYDRFDIIVEIDGGGAVSFVTDGIRKRFHEDKYIIFEDGANAYIWIDGTADKALYSQDYKYMNSKKGGFAERRDIVSSKIMYISLGMLPEKVKTIQDLGMDIIPRTLSYSGFNDTKYAEAVVDGYANYGIVPEYIIVGGEAIMGYDDGSEFAKNYIKDNGITIGLIENTTQLQNILQYGVEDVAISTDYDTVRVFSVWNYIQYRYRYYGYKGAEEIENTLFRAVTERNIRVIYFKPFMENQDLHTYITNVDDYREMFANLQTRLGEHGFEFGSATLIRSHQVSTIFKILLGIGSALGAVLLLRCFLPIRKKAAFILAGLGILAVIGAFFVMPKTSELIASFAAAVVFACLAVTFFTYRSRILADSLGNDAGIGRIIGGAAVTLVISVLIALAGGMMTAAPLCSTSYMLEIDIFRGVKLAQLLPLAYFIIAFLSYYGYGARKKKTGTLELHDIFDLLNLSIKIWMVILIGIAGIVGIYYIMRTGHDSSVEVSSAEMLFRNKLEDVLLARPRSKEFLFAFPAIMMMVYTSVRKLKLWSLVFGAAGVIGMTSVVNTFMHIRTPLYLGFVRTGYSLLFGLVLGAVAIVIFDLLYRLYKKSAAKYVEAALKE
ncbi:MAG: DUF5693 family protein [Clostridia bacterium]|nr:DUF5693 family protein [Clostridia bacterium]